MSDAERIEELEKALRALSEQRDSLLASLEEEKDRVIHPLAGVVLDEICDRVRRDGTDGYLSSVVAWASAGFPITTKPEPAAPTKPTEPPILAMIKDLRLDDSGHGWLTLIGEARDIAGLATQWHQDVEIRVPHA